MFNYLSLRFGPIIDLDVSREKFRFRVDFFADRHRRGRDWPHERALVLVCRYSLMSVQSKAERVGFPDVVET